MALDELIPKIKKWETDFQAYKQELKIASSRIEAVLADDQVMASSSNEINSYLDSIAKVIAELKVVVQQTSDSKLKIKREMNKLMGILADLMKNITLILDKIEKKWDEEINLIRVESGLVRSKEKHLENLYTDLKRYFSHHMGHISFENFLSTELNFGKFLNKDSEEKKTAKQISKDLRRLLIHSKRVGNLNRLKRQVRMIWTDLQKMKFDVLRPNLFRLTENLEKLASRDFDELIKLTKTLQQQVRLHSAEVNKIQLEIELGFKRLEAESSTLQIIWKMADFNIDVCFPILSADKKFRSKNPGDINSIRAQSVILEFDEKISGNISWEDFTTRAKFVLGDILKSNRPYSLIRWVNYLLSE